MGKMVGRYEMAHFLDTTPKTTETWSEIGEGHPNLSTTYNGETETQQWINQKTGSTYLKNYAATIDTSQVAHVGDEVFDFIDDLSYNMAVGADAETNYLEVRIYKATDMTTIPARKFRVSIVVGSEGDAATDPLTREYSINFMGDPVLGTFNPDTKTFTPTPAA